MRRIRFIYDFFRLWILWRDRKEAWQDAKFKHDPHFQNELRKLDLDEDHFDKLK